MQSTTHASRIRLLLYYLCYWSRLGLLCWERPAARSWHSMNMHEYAWIMFSTRQRQRTTGHLELVAKDFACVTAHRRMHQMNRSLSNTKKVQKQLGNTTCVLILEDPTRISFDNRRVSTMSFSYRFVANRKRFSHLHVVSSDCKYGPWTGPASTNKKRRLHWSTPLQIKASSNWKPQEQRKKNATWRPAPKYSRHILTWSIHIKSASWSKNFLSPRHLGPFPQTARLKGKKHQLYRAVEVWKLEVSSTEVMLLWWLTPWEMKVSVASILSVLRWKNSNAVGCCRHILHGLDSCNSSLKPCITVIETNLMIRNMRDRQTIGARIRQDPLLSGWAVKKSIIGIKKNISLRKNKNIICNNDSNNIQNRQVKTKWKFQVDRKF